MAPNLPEHGSIELTTGGEAVAVNPSAETLAALRGELDSQEACHAFGSSNADQLASLLVEVRKRLAEQGGLSDQLILCQVAERLQWVRDVVQMAGKSLQQHELVFGVSTMSNHCGLVKEVETLGWAIAVLMGRTAEPAPV